MGSNVDTIKQRLDIVEVVSPYLKLEKAGANFKARCPFHHEKTASFMVSPTRQTYYCFGCGAKGDIFSFVEEMEGLDFKGALKSLADKAGVELKFERIDPDRKDEKDRLYSVLEEAARFFEVELGENKIALEYLKSRGIEQETIKHWRLGFAPDTTKGEWRALYSHLISLGFSKELILKAGLAKYSEDNKSREPYDVFRDRIIFPLSDAGSRIVGFSGRAMGDGQPKYLNSPDTPVFTKGELLYGLDKAKESIRRKDYAVLVEGQIDLVLAHQSGVTNVVASSGTAFTRMHLERLKRLSGRILLAFDGDSAGEKAAEKSAILGLSLGMEVKIAKIPQGKDPADLVKENPELWKSALKDSKHAIEHVLMEIVSVEKDRRKQGKLVEKKVLPLIGLLESNIEKSHFVSLLSKHIGLSEEVVWQDLKQVKIPEVEVLDHLKPVPEPSERLSRRDQIERRLMGIIFWQKHLALKGLPWVDVSSIQGELVKRSGQEHFDLLCEKFADNEDELIFEAEDHYHDDEKLTEDIVELLDNLSDASLRANRDSLISELSRAEAVKDEELVRRLSTRILDINRELQALEDKKKMR